MKNKFVKICLLEDLVTICTNTIFIIFSASKLPDPFPQKSCLGTVWHRYNFKENRGEICIPSIRDLQAPGEIYLCQLCGNVTLHIHSVRIGSVKAGSMKQIFQDLLAEIIRLYYTPGVSNVPVSNIPVLRNRKTSVGSVDSNKVKFSLGAVTEIVTNTLKLTKMQLAFPLFIQAVVYFFHVRSSSALVTF